VSQTSSSIQAVTNMAATVRAACIAGNGTVPAGYFVVGDGAVIGTKQ
jgi:hypothetical protein